MRAKIVRCCTAVILAVTLCLSPYACAKCAYANPLVLTAGEAAFAAVCAVFGVSVASNEDAKALFADWQLYTEDIDALSAQVSAMQDAAIEVGTANGTLVNATKQQVTQDEINAINTMFDTAGQAGSLWLDGLSIMASNGQLGILPFLLSDFISSHINSSSIEGLNSVVVQGAPPLLASIMDADANVNLAGTNNGLSYYLQPVIQFYYGGNLYGYFSRGSGTRSILIGSPADNYFKDGLWFLADIAWSMFDGAKWVSVGSFVDLLTSWGFEIYNSGSQQFFDISVFSRAVGGVVFSRNFGYNVGGFIDGTFYSRIAYKSTGSLEWTGNVTTNPDVNLGHDYWDDAKDQVDVLNPAAGAAVIGSDAVIDGDYIKSRGSIAVPTDWSNVNSWADALARTHAGVAQGALDGTIAGTTTGTAVNVGTGELVTDTVGELVKPDAGTSVSPTTPKFDWSKFLDPSLYLVFPFCLPWDLVDLVKTLSAEPQAPVIDWPMPSMTGQQTLHVDLSPWSPVAAVLRAGELVAAAIGLIWITKTMIKM